MKQSTLFGKTNKSAKEFDSTNATLLIKAGFIDQVMAGGYTYLTLGLRVLSKIENIIREEMNKISTEVLMPSIVPTQLWEQSGRLNTIDVLMKAVPANDKAKEKNDTEYVLNCTHEDVVTPLAAKFYTSYKDLPMSVYQIQTKFRNEPRAKSGLLRCREFRMKDMYSFHRSNDDLLKYYDVAKEAYWKVYERLGLKEHTYVALASGGDFTKNFSHEFQVRVDAGEDILFHVPSKNLTFNREVAPSQAPAIATEDQKEKQEFNSPAVGVDKLAKEIGIRVDQTTKTMLYENEKGEIIAAAVRGGYAIDEEKLKKISGSESITLANAEAVEKAGTVIGFVGAHGLAPGVKVYWDESTANRTNFEIGGNKKDLHLYNVNWGRDIEEPKEFYDFKVAQQGDIYPETGETYEVFKAAEVGNIFPLETKFSKAFGYNFIDENNQPGIVYMGSYGIGPSRIMGVLVEKFHDDKGIVWPEAVAPFTVHLLGFNLDDEAVMKRATEIYNFLTEKGIDVLFDDRNKGPGEKFADSDLIGIPHRIVVSKKTGEQVEYKPRNSANALMVSLDEAVDMIQSK
jgi:prolyl-tRNA synthetase